MLVPGETLKIIQSNVLLLLTEKSRIRESKLLEECHTSVNSKIRAGQTLLSTGLGSVTLPWYKIRYSSSLESCTESVARKGEIIINDILQPASHIPRSIFSYHPIICKTRKLIKLVYSESVHNIDFV